PRAGAWALCPTLRARGCGSSAAGAAGGVGPLPGRVVGQLALPWPLLPAVASDCQRGATVARRGTTCPNGQLGQSRSTPLSRGFRAVVSRRVRLCPCLLTSTPDPTAGLLFVDKGSPTAGILSSQKRRPAVGAVAGSADHGHNSAVRPGTMAGDHGTPARGQA